MTNVVCLEDRKASITCEMTSVGVESLIWRVIKRGLESESTFSFALKEAREEKKSKPKSTREREYRESDYHDDKTIEIGNTVSLPPCVRGIGQSPTKIVSYPFSRRRSGRDSELHSHT
jgi:hypothetical protein